MVHEIRHAKRECQKAERRWRLSKFDSNLAASKIKRNTVNNLLKEERKGFYTNLRWLDTVLRAVSGNSRDGACFKLDKQTRRRKKQWYTEDNFSKSAH